MEKNELLRRMEDLCERAERSGTDCSSGYLSPAERYQTEEWAKRRGCTVVFSGGGADCERTAAFFLPEYMSAEDFDPSEHFAAIKLTAHFGEPGHRDYMGAVLGMGVGREWVGDIRVMGDTAYIFCLPSVHRHLLSIDKVGRCGVTAENIAPEDVPQAKREVKEKSFSVMSMRLDAVTAGMFDLSRTEAAKEIRLGNVSLNYEPTEKPDAQISAGDIISLRGAGKGSVTGTGGTSRKGRLFVYAEILK